MNEMITKENVEKISYEILKNKSTETFKVSNDLPYFSLPINKARFVNEDGKILKNKRKKVKGEEKFLLPIDMLASLTKEKALQDKSWREFFITIVKEWQESKKKKGEKSANIV